MGLFQLTPITLLQLSKNMGIYIKLSTNRNIVRKEMKSSDFSPVKITLIDTNLADKNFFVSLKPLRHAGNHGRQHPEIQGRS